MCAGGVSPDVSTKFSASYVLPRWAIGKLRGDLLYIQISIARFKSNDRTYEVASTTELDAEVSEQVLH